MQNENINPGTRQNFMKAWRIRDSLEEENIINTTFQSTQKKHFEPKGQISSSPWIVFWVEVDWTNAGPHTEMRSEQATCGSMKRLH